MALIKCSECGKEISDLAEACPGCGAPQKGSTVKSKGAVTNSVRVERAGFKWEATGFVLILGAMIAGFSDSNSVAVLLGVVGFVVFVIGRVIN